MSESVNEKRPGKPAPPVDALSQAFWDACNQGQLSVQVCGECGQKQLYPRVACTQCQGRQLRLELACGKGLVRSFTIIRRAVSAAFEPDVPYVVALVALDEGPTLMSNIVHCEVDQVSIGQRVCVTFEARGDQQIYQFEPETDG